MRSPIAPAKITDSWTRHRCDADAGREIARFLRRPPEGPAARGGVRHDLIDAVFALGGERRSRASARAGEGAAELRRDRGRDQPARRLQARGEHPQEGEMGRAAGDDRQTSRAFRRPARRTRWCWSTIRSSRTRSPRSRRARGRRPAAGEGADRGARQGRAQGGGGDRQGGFHRRDGRAGLATRSRSTNSSTM